MFAAGEVRPVTDVGDSLRLGVEFAGGVLATVDDFPRARVFDVLEAFFVAEVHVAVLDAVVLNDFLREVGLDRAADEALLVEDGTAMRWFVGGEGNPHRVAALNPGVGGKRGVFADGVGADACDDGGGGVVADNNVVCVVRA